MINKNFFDVTEISGDQISSEQLYRMHHRYVWATKFCSGLDVVELACGAGQGLDLLNSVSSSLIAGDIDDKILKIAKSEHPSLSIENLDATSLPFDDNSKDVIILFEAIYYLSDVHAFIRECYRVLREGGLILVATANCDAIDFNPSPFSVKYYGVKYLNDIFTTSHFNCNFYAFLPFSSVSLRQKFFRVAKFLAVKFNLIPSSMKSKKLLKKIVFGSMVTMPSSVNGNEFVYSDPSEIPSNLPNTTHKVLYMLARKK